MGAQCAVFGHVYDETEFEEHRMERPRGEVLVCREYQICGRCGNRTEMYRNERLLTPGDQGEGRERKEAKKTADPTAEASDSGRDASDPAVETTDNGREESDPAAEAPADDGGSAAGNTPANHPPTDSSSSGEPRAGGSADDARGGHSVDGTRIEGSIDETRIEGVPDGTRIEGSSDTTQAEDGVGSGDRADEASADPEAGHMSPDTSPSGASRTDDAVILSDGAADPISAGSEPGNGGTQRGEPDGGPTPAGDSGPAFEREADEDWIGCRTCGRTWKEGETSLRDGDMCPGCIRGYVERT